MRLASKPRNDFEAAIAIIAHVSMQSSPFADIADEETVHALTTIEAYTFNTVRAANELFWCQEKAWKTYRLSRLDSSIRAGLRPSDQIEIHWWAFVNYVYQFEEKIKLYVNAYNAFAPWFEYPPILNPGKIIQHASNRLRRFTQFRHDSIHQAHYPPAQMGQLPLVELMQENQEFFERMPDAGYLSLPPKFLFRLTRRGMHMEMQAAMSEMAALATSVTQDHRLNILRACFRVTSYTQWARAGQATFKFGTQ